MISVIGLGPVGTIVAASLARDGHPIIASDRDASVVEDLRGGRTRLIEPGLAALVMAAFASEHLQVSTDVAACVSRSALSIVCVGTPNICGVIDLSQLVDAMETIGHALASMRQRHVVVIRSTLLPGTITGTVIPTLESCSGRTCGPDFGVCYCPEFLREGDALNDFRDPSKIVVGERDAQDGDAALALFPHPQQASIIRTDFASAEMLKYIDNAWHALKVDFGNEIGSLAKVLGLDGRALMAHFARDTRLNISPAYLAPGAPYGGSCLPKDVAALCALARERQTRVPLLDAIAASNAAHAERLQHLVAAQPGERIGIVGAAFKVGSGDMRGSPYVALAWALADAGNEVRIFEPAVAGGGGVIERGVGDDRGGAWGGAPVVVETCRGLVEFADVLVICHRNGECVEALRRMPRGQKRVVDLVGVGGDLDGDAGYVGICW